MVVAVHLVLGVDVHLLQGVVKDAVLQHDEIKERLTVVEVGHGALVLRLTARLTDDLAALGQVRDGGGDRGHQQVPLAGG